MTTDQFDGAALFDFLTQTPEAGLRKILVEKQFTQEHFNMLLKIVRVCNTSTFTEHFLKCDYPKIKFSPKEMTLKEKFWNDLITVCNSRGLLSPAQKVAA